MEIKFTEEFITHIPTECLIQDVQILRRAIYTEVSWERTINAVECVIECLCGAIERYTIIPGNTGVHPSSSSVTAMSEENGILLHEDGSDLRCVAGKPASFAMRDGVLQCDEACPFYGNACTLDKDGILLEGNVRFDYDESPDKMLEQLKAYKVPATPDKNWEGAK